MRRRADISSSQSTQGNNRQYGAKGDYALYPDRKELKLADMTFRFDTAYWSMPHPGLIQWGGPGIRVTNFELRNRTNGRVYANGLLPTSGVADFALRRRQLSRCRTSSTSCKRDIDMTGMLTLARHDDGHARRTSVPRGVRLLDGTYNGADRSRAARPLRLRRRAARGARRRATQRRPADDGRRRTRADQSRASPA